MDAGRKWPPRAGPPQHNPGQRPAQPRAKGVLQPKAANAQARPAPTAPPVYRPQPVPRVLQAKAAAGQKAQGVGPMRQAAPPAARPPAARPDTLQAKEPAASQPLNQRHRAPSAPPVYRPQPTPKVLQRQTAGVRTPHAGRTPQSTQATPASRPQQRRPAGALKGGGQAIQRRVLSIGNIDKTIEKNEKALLAAKGGAKVRLSDTDQPLADLQTGETLYINAHGNTDTLGRMRPLELAKELLRNGLPADYEGKIYLHGCNSATEVGGTSYAERFQKALAKLGMRVRVKGNSGFSNIDKRTGKASVMGSDDQSTTDWEILQEQMEELEDLAKEYTRLLEDKELRDLANEQGGARELGACEAAFQWVKSALARVQCLASCCGGGTGPDVEPLLIEDAELERARREFKTQKKFVQSIRDEIFKRDKHLRPTLPLPDATEVHPMGRKLADLYRARSK
jgi:hypothetical protein